MSAYQNNSGKIGAQTFKEELLPFCGAKRHEVLCGPTFGVDSAVIDLGNGLALATSSDPLSLIPALGMEASAWLSVHLLANDMATTGLAPQFAQFVLNLPVSLLQKDFREYWQHIHKLCSDLGIAITGGHTGQIEGQNSTISGGGTMFLTAPKDQILTSNNARPGNVIIVTKKLALSSSSILAMIFPETVRNKCGAEIQHRAAQNFWQLSVMKEALTASHILRPNFDLCAMHDVTEGGVLGAISEMAAASGCSFRVENQLLPLSTEVEAITTLFKIDPRLSIGAGSMIIAVKPEVEDTLIDSLKGEGIEATAVGTFTEKECGNTLVEKGEERPFRFTGIDPYWKAFFQALKAEWK